MNSLLSEALINQFETRKKLDFFCHGDALSQELLHPLIIKAKDENKTPFEFQFQDWVIHFSPEKKETSCLGFPHEIYRVKKLGISASLFFPHLGNFDMLRSETDQSNQVTSNIMTQWMEYCFSDDQWADYGRWIRFSHELTKLNNHHLIKIEPAYYVFSLNLRERFKKHGILFEENEDSIILTPGWSWGLKNHHKLIEILEE